MMRAAVRLAARGHGGAEPNPLVGCILTNPTGAVIARGWHDRCGGPHAEAVALAVAGERAKQSTVYCTLEPCAHHGRTPPCADALIAAQVSRVVYGSSDPNVIASAGAARLAAAGIVVEQLECDEVRVLNGPFIHRIRTGLPWITTKWAITLDGRITTGDGGPRWITGESSRKLVHRERGRVDVMLTGIGTLLADDPDLRPRGVRARRMPRRVVIDKQLQMSESCRLLKTVNDSPVELIVFPEVIEQQSEKISRLRALGVRIEPLERGDDGMLILRPLLLRLGREGMSNVLVESGGGVNGELFNERLVNEVWVFQAGIVVGDGRGVGPIRGLAMPAALPPSTRCVAIDRVGDDLVSRWLVERA
ncbi:MAG: bifunctional diaminohydroxyphosphoribosylaminopyrimidine deaminase/5-amino-6-(5-phosphoribosylamino)uracil reductase RibD [Planctomycetota bacterium]|nr:bifunctional diaminohydroxyphosphoribosylaminopyrimidine deaminase/5-amino-6-(5-phosphoribosylamino)uracil reductase RibD [Planctomycetota bacterium]